jgi:hypothetical protein
LNDSGSQEYIETFPNIINKPSDFARFWGEDFGKKEKKVKKPRIFVRVQGGRGTAKPPPLRLDLVHPTIS